MLRALAACTLLAVAACGSSSPGSGNDAGLPPTTSTITGTYAFPVHFALVLPSTGGCGYPSKLASGAYNSFEIALAGEAVPAVCSGVSGATGPVGQPFVLVQVASPSFTSGMVVPDGGGAPLTPGIYPIGFEDESDDDLCMLQGSGGTALVDVLDFADAGATNVATSISGSVTLDTVGNGHIAGSFTVMVAGVLGSSIDTASPTPLSGTFDATECPGTKQ